jgi:hypothetical protein
VFAGLAIGGVYLYMKNRQGRAKAPPGEEPAPVDGNHPAGKGTGVGAPPPVPADFMANCGYYYVDATKGKSSALDPAKLFPTNTQAMNEGWVKEWNDGAATANSYIGGGKCVFNVRKGAAGTNTNVARALKGPDAGPPMADWKTFRKLGVAGGPQLADWRVSCACRYQDNQGPYGQLSGSEIQNFNRPGQPTYDLTVQDYRVVDGKCNVVIGNRDTGEPMDFTFIGCDDPNRLKTNVPRDAPPQGTLSGTDAACKCYGEDNVRVRAGLCVKTGGGGIRGVLCK